MLRINQAKNHLMIQITPATNFQPTVVYLDKEAVTAASASSFIGEKSVFDPKFPAANFEPKVIYP